MNDTKGIFSELKEETYTNLSLVPPMKWIKKEKPLSPKSGEIDIQESTIKISWKTPDKIEDGGIMYNLYASNSYPVDINRGENLIDCNIRKSEYLYTPSSPWKSRIYYAITAVDRYGNESEPLYINEPLKF